MTLLHYVVSSDSCGLLPPARVNYDVAKVNIYVESTKYFPFILADAA